MKTIRIHFGLLLASALSGKATLWDSPKWALVGQASGSVGYDSNLTLNKNGDGSGFIAFEPQFVLKRIPSASRLEFSAATRVTRFFDGDRASQFDPSFAADYAYSQDENDLPKITANLSWNRSTTGNASVGDRILTAYTRGNFGGRFLSTEKTSVLAQISYDGVDYRSARFIDNQRASITLGLGYEPQPLVEYSINLVSSLGETNPSQPDPGSTKNWEEGLTLRFQGQLSPKVTGSIYAGAAVVKYHGSFQRTDALPLGGGEIGWQMTPRGWLYGGLEFGPDYSPAGESVAMQRVSLRYEQTIYGAWKSEIQLSPAQMVYARQTREREDRTITTGLAILYEPSLQFSVRCAYDFTRQESDTLSANFDRHFVSARFTSRF